MHKLQKSIFAWPARAHFTHKVGAESRPESPHVEVQEAVDPGAHLRIPRVERVVVLTMFGNQIRANGFAGINILKG